MAIWDRLFEDVILMIQHLDRPVLSGKIEDVILSANFLSEAYVNFCVLAGAFLRGH